LVKADTSYTFLRRAALCVVAASMAVLEGQSPAVAPTVTIGRQEFQITTAAGTAVDPFMISLDWSRPHPQIIRAVVIFHGKGRDVKSDYRNAVDAAAGAGAAARETVIVAPQFLDEEDADAHSIPSGVLRWRRTEWDAGIPAAGPVPMSSYDVVDSLLFRLADRSIFPNLRTVVMAGHSAGAQLVQRYAVVGRAPAALSGTGIHFRFVIANASSYVYFSDERPGPGGLQARFRGACKTFNHWKYGIAGGPAYLSAQGENDWQRRETDYAQQDVIYLFGTADNDPREKDLDVSCGGEAQGPTRFARGQYYYAYLSNRNRARWSQRMWFVPGVAHSARQMFLSACGVAALFDSGGCQDR
jgi:hypothetical protein